MRKEVKESRACRWIMLAGLLLVTMLQAGCLHRQLSLLNWNTLDPGSYKAWAEDEAYEITWYQQSRQLKQLREDVAKMPRAVQVKHAVALGDNILEMSDNVALQLELIRTLGAFDVPEATAGLRLASESDIPEVRIAACRAWALQSSPERVGILLERVVGETDKDVRIAAMRSLGGCQSVEDQTRIRESLQDVLDDEDPAVQYAATESLEASSGLDLNGNIRLWKRFLAGELNEKQAMENAASVRDSYFQQLIKSGITIGDVMPWNWF